MPVSIELARIVLPYSQTDLVLNTSRSFEDLGFTPSTLMRMIRQVESHFLIQFTGMEIVRLRTFGRLLSAIYKKGGYDIGRRCPSSKEVGDQTAYQLPVALGDHPDLFSTVLLRV